MIDLYSPEDSDTHPWGDWQTLLGTSLIAGLIFCVILLVAL